MIKCPLTGSLNTKIIYQQKGVPLIQNMVYPTMELAKNVPKIDVTLAQSMDNGFVFSANFDESIIQYDQNYQNEQSNSGFFQNHLRTVINIMKENCLLGKKIVEIGCGKAFFMDMLLNQGEDVTGFDPTYEGDSPKVIKDYFSDKYSDIGAETIILRHTLEHISEPYHFLKTVANANNNRGFIYIEVPTFEWIVANNAIEDIFYEHCNYFTLETLQKLFTESVGGHLFNGQYIYVIADLSKLKKQIEPCLNIKYDIRFSDKIGTYTELVSKSKNLALWGAGAKGSTFLNLIDPYFCKVKCVIDINPKKQNMFMGGTGHPIISIEEAQKYNIENAIVMNINYMKEIQLLADKLKINLITLQ